MMMQRSGIVLLAFLVQLLCWSTLALAQSCAAGAGLEPKAMSADAFFAQRIGAVALGGDCNERTRSCTTYYDISNCTSVAFPVALSGTADRLFLVFNTMSRCDGACDWVDSFLQTIVLYPPGASERAYAPFIGLSRNYSERWAIYQGREATRLKCCEQDEGDMLQYDDYLAWESDGVGEDLLFQKTRLPWHSAFRPGGSPEGTTFNLLDGSFLAAFGGQSSKPTWDLRDFFRTRLSQCPGCSAKLGMLRFQETVAKEATRRPASPLFQAFNVMTYHSIRISTHVPLAEGVYDRSFSLELLR